MPFSRPFHGAMDPSPRNPRVMPLDSRLRVLFQYQKFCGAWNAISSGQFSDQFWSQLYYIFFELHPTVIQREKQGNEADRIFRVALKCEIAHFYDVLELSFRALAKTKDSFRLRSQR